MYQRKIYAEINKNNIHNDNIGRTWKSNWNESKHLENREKNEVDF